MIFRFLLFAVVPLALYADAPGGNWVWEGENARIEIETSTSGQIARWTLEGRKLVETASPVSPLLLHDRSGVSWSFVPKETQEEAEQLTVIGDLVQSDAPEMRMAAQLHYEIANGGRELAVEIATRTPPKRAVFHALWQLDLALNPRKRTFFLSDYGLKWETRYFFQLTYEPRAGRDSYHLLPEPDRNEWRFFALDQFTPNAYRLWKAESDQTSPLIMHEGRRPAPFAQIYDERGGVTLEYPQMNRQTPASLRVDAGGSGRLEVAFQPGLSIRFVLTAQSSEEGILSERAELIARYGKEATPLPDPEKALEEPDWVVSASGENGGPLYVTGGYPFGKGALKDSDHLAVEVAGKAVTLQAHPLAYWPDGSIKWARLVFPVASQKESDDAATPRITFRNGAALPVSIGISDKAAPASSTELQTTISDAGEVRVDNGDLTIELGTGTHWLRKLTFGKETVVDADSPAVAYCHYRLNPDAVHPFTHQLKGGIEDKGVLKVDSLKVVESGPLRTVVRLEGLTTNREPTRIILQLVFLAGRPEVRISHSTVFRFADPRKTFLTALGLELPLPSAMKAEKIALTQAAVESRRLEINGRAESGADDQQGWIRIGKPKCGITAVIRNFREQAPKAIVADQGRLRFELWPQSVPPMDVRRYSNELHPAQLESPVTVPIKSDWINAEYYRSAPFYGISRTHEMLLSFSVRDPEALAADFQSPPLLYAGWDHYESTGVVLPASVSEKWTRAWEAWTRLTRFFLYHRELHRWYGFWNFGDFRHRFRRGYGWSHPPRILAGILNGDVNESPSGIQKSRWREYYPPNDWNYDNGAYGWSNTEGLPGLFLQYEYLRHGNRSVYFAAEAMARYARDVVTRQEGRWLGRGTRHGVQPWSDGQHDERQTSINEYRLHYFLSGDERSRDVITNLYENVYTKGVVASESFHSARLGGLLFRWEITGDPEEAEQLRRYIGLFLSDEGIYLSPSARFPGPMATRPPEQLNAGSMFIHTFGGMHALLEYQQITNDQELERSLFKMADAMIRKPLGDGATLANSDYFWAPVAFAALNAAEPAPYCDYLRRYLAKTEAWRSLYQPVSSVPTGRGAFMVQAVPHTFFWANWAPYVTRALDRDDIWNAGIAAQYEAFEEGQDLPPPPRLRWQSEYDRVPALEPYLGRQQPWSKP